MLKDHRDDLKSLQEQISPIESRSLEDYCYAQKISLQDVLEHITGPVVSVIVHVIGLALLCTIMVFQPPEQKASLLVEIKELELKELAKPLELPPPPEESSSESPSEAIERPAPVSISSSVEVSSVSVDPAVSVNVEIPDIKMNSSALKMPGVYASRLSAEGRGKALLRHGADPRNEESVSKALKWLKENQNDDGSWGVFPESRYAFTALATLAFLAHGETPQSQDYGPTIVKALKKMVRWVEEADNYVGPGDTYSHPVVAYALAEAYGITRIPMLKASMEKAVDVVVSNINKNGSYSYWYDRVPRIQRRDPVTGLMPNGDTPQPPCDLSFAGWNYQALKAALSAGCELPGLDQAIDMSLKGLKAHCDEKDGGFSVAPGGKPDFGMSSLGILCMGLLGEGDSKEARKSLEWVKKNNRLGLKTCSWRYSKDVHEEYGKAFTFAIYTWYYQTQMLFQATHGQGPVWQAWNSAFSKSLISEQSPDGSWSTPAEKYGSSDLDPKKVNAEWSHVRYFESPKDLKIYATAYCCLSLEVYYRYLPTYKLLKEGRAKGHRQKEADDLLL